MLREFTTIEEMKEYGKDFAKKQYELVSLNGRKKILCGTDMAYEEAIWAGVNDVLEEMYNKFVTKEMEEEKDNGRCLFTDKTSEIRDEIIKWFEETFDVEFVDVYTEY